MDIEKSKKLLKDLFLFLVENDYILLYSEILDEDILEDFSKEKSIEILQNFNQFEIPKNWTKKIVYAFTITKKGEKLCNDIYNGKKIEEIIDDVCLVRKHCEQEKL